MALDDLDTSINLDFLAHYLGVRGLADSISGSAQPQITREGLRGVTVPLPPLEEQRRIAAILDKADELRQQRRAALQKLDSLTQSLFLDMFGDPLTNPKRWKYIPLGSASEIQGGLQLTPRRQTLTRKAPYLRVANVMRNALRLDEIKMIGVTDGELERTRLKSGDILFVEGHGNAGEIGRCAIWDGSIEGCIHQNHLIRSRLDSGIFTAEYVSAFFNSPVGRRQLLSAGKTTSGLNTISTTDVKKAQLPQPPLDLQIKFSKTCEWIGRSETNFNSMSVAVESAFANLQHRAFRGEL